MNINAIDQTITEPNLNMIKKKINEARQLMPFLLSLSPSQRRGKFKLSHKRYDFVAITIPAAKADPAIVPVWVDTKRLQNDFIVSDQLLGIENMLQGLLNDVRDTRMQAGGEALKAALDIYDHLQVAKDRLPGTKALYDELRASYPGRGKNKVKKE